ncbi:MAG: site-specific DNA-methyltransferase [Candidatus Tokpelaia sp.]|uniref:DNA-methyltransferase n=1 Tax=Candidatus Tokpelaia sp. TaxID=2233777 RepID=UPI00123BD5D0|nr:site-specific DNA-methyltransferase [Candidatus Tokpelaia sp.]KAA6204667.1 MAG: site-specific DNA-methyltransferase [Candidatus Tokpelaia sp.]KAA6206115.1 MAG: site-specific DNA-methyltransferase [Candidatus Tokpelaia sp.]KAA6405724.1 site-specific DNA-methyltransferase [Candidatus Tokpelaia sp.]
MIFGDKNPAYSTSLGAMYIADSLDMLALMPDNSVNLVITSPPFALQRKKEYGNYSQEQYGDWFMKFAELTFRKLKKDGSFVVDFGGAYAKGVPVRSTYNFRIMLRLIDEIGFYLAEDFYWFNPSKLPSPIEWVNKRKIRVKDSINTVWWFSKTEWPKANITNVLVPYSARMKKLIKDPDKFFSPRVRPSGHSIDRSFGKDNGGAIPSNLLQIPNSESNGDYLSSCKKIGIKGHPARFPSKFPEFFIKMLTDPGDLIVDIFGGSNTTGYAAERLKRRWLSFELSPEYTAASIFRFTAKNLGEKQLRNIYESILDGRDASLENYRNKASYKKYDEKQEYLPNIL